MSQAKKYPLTLVLIAVLLTGPVGLFNYYTDPYALFDFKNADSNRLSRVDQFYHMRVTKPWHMREVEATAVVVGSSRSARLHPKHSSWANNKGYNLVVPGMTMQENMRFIQHANAIAPLSKLMMGLDYEAFIRPVPVTRPGFEEARMARSRKDINSLASKRQYVSDLVDSLFSVPALSLSLAATTGALPPGRRYFKDGTWEITSTVLTGRSGYVYVGSNVIIAHRTERFDTSQNLKKFADILHFCHENKIDARFFFTPTHVFFVDLWHRLGYKSLWRGFHHQIVKLNQEIAKETGNEPFPLWGFSQADGIVNEPIYRTKNAHKGWYDDGVHSRVPLGKKMMNDVWGEKAKIGVQVVPGNVDVYLAEVMFLVDDFNNKNHRMVSELHQKIGL